MKFVCSFAWADLEVSPEELKFVGKLVDNLGLDADEVTQVQGWLNVPPAIGEVDPTKVPLQHRELFMAAARGLVKADGVVAEDEAVSLALFDQLMR